MTNPVHSVGGARVWQRIVSPHPDPTLTLSLGERGQPPRGACFAHTRLPNSVAGIVLLRDSARFTLSPGERAGVRRKKM